MVLTDGFQHFKTKYKHAWQVVASAQTKSNPTGLGFPGKHRTKTF
jgi:hypothetical protein